MAVQNDQTLTSPGGTVRNKQQAPRPAPPISCNVRIFIKLLLKRNQNVIKFLNYRKEERTLRLT